MDFRNGLMRIPSIVVAFAIAVAALSLGGCVQPAAEPLPAARPVSAVTVTFSDHAQELAASDPRLTPAAVALAIEAELRAQQLYAPGAASVHRTLAITVEDFTSTLASNSSVMGYTFRNVVLIGEVQVQAEQSGTQPPVQVHARARASNRDSNAGNGSLAELYARFAVLSVEALRGIETPSEFIPR